MSLPIRAFAIAAVLLMLTPGFSPAVAEAVRREEMSTVTDLQEAVLALDDEGPTPEAVARVREALDGLPPAFRSSPALRELEASLAVLDDPIVAQLLAPLLRDGTLDEMAENPEAARKAIADLEEFQRELGLSEILAGSSAAAFAAATDDLNATDPAAFGRDFSALPDARILEVVAALASLTSDWSGATGSPLAAAVDETATAVAARPVAELRAGAAPDAATSDAAARTLQVFRDILAKRGLSPDAEHALSAEDRAAVDEFRAGLATRLADRAKAFGLDENAFAGIPGSGDYPYVDTAGPVAVDGVPIADAELASLAAASATVPLPIAGLPGSVAVNPVPVELAATPTVLDAATAADLLRLPGSRAAPFTGSIPTDHDAFEVPDGTERDLFSGVHEGLVGPYDAADNFTVFLPQDAYVRIFLERTAGGNPDLEVRCSDTGRVWASRSAQGSKLEHLDTVTFVNNREGANAEAAFAKWPFSGGAERAACPSSNFTVSVRHGIGAAVNTTYLLAGDWKAYDGRSCPMYDETCGLNWARWGDRCSASDEGCLLTKPPTILNPLSFFSGSEVDGLRRYGNLQRWAALDANGAENPVLFVHGVGSDASSWTHPHSQGQFKFVRLEHYELTKILVVGIASAAILLADSLIALQLYITIQSFFAGPSLIGLLFGMAQLVQGLMTLASFTFGLLKFTLVLFTTWRRGDTEDLEGMMWEMRNRGFETYWFEYNRGDNNARLGQAKYAAWQLKWAVSAVQQEFYDRHSRDPGFPHRAPEDIEVDLVAHSMGGLVSRVYTVDHRLVREGPLEGPLYEGDVNKLIMLQTPNMGSGPASFIVKLATFSLGDLLKDILLEVIHMALEWIFKGWLFVGYLAGYLSGRRFTARFSLSVSGQVGSGAPGKWDAFGILAILLSYFVKWMVGRLVYEWKDMDQRLDIVRDSPAPGETTVEWVNARDPAIDVDHGLIFGDPLDGSLIGTGRFDTLVAEEDVKGPDSLVGVSAVARIHNDHLSALFGQSTRTILTAWLKAADPPAAGAPAAAGFGAAASGGSLLATFGQDAGGHDVDSGAKYVPDAGLAAGAGWMPRAAPQLGDRSERLQRLAAEKGLASVGAYAGVGPAVRAAHADLDGSATQEDAAGAIDRALDGLDGVFDGPLANPAELQMAADLAADVAILRSGQYDEAAALLGRVGEPYVLVDPMSDPADLAGRRVVLLPTGSLSGLASQTWLVENLRAYVENGGTLVSLAQRRGADLAALPGSPSGFGFAEEDGAYRASVVLSSFTAALSGQAYAAPDVHVDGSFTDLPASATVLLRAAKSGRPVLAEWPVGEGRVIAGQLLADWADRAGRGTLDEALLVRDLVASARSPASTSLAAPGAAASVTLSLALPPEAASVDLVLVDPAARDVLVAAAAPGDLTLAIPAGRTAAGLYEVDAILRAENGTILRRILGVESVYVAHFAGDAASFRSTLSDVVVDVTSADDRVEEGRAFAAEIRVANLGDEARTVTVGWWFPEHFARTQDPAYGGAPARDGAPAAWAENFRLATTVTLEPGATAVVPAGVPGALRSDALAARVTEAGTDLGQASRAFTVYRPSVAVEAATARTLYAAGEDATVRLAFRDLAAGATAASYSVRFVATLRGPDGVAAAVRETTASVSSTGSETSLLLPLPSPAARGAWRVDVEAYKAATRVGGATATFRVPGVQIAVAATLPEAIVAGAPEDVTWRLRNVGAQAAPTVTFAAELVDPQGTVRWTGTAGLALPAGGETNVTLPVVAPSAALGTWELRHTVSTDEGTFAGSTALPSRVSVSVSFAQSTWRVRDAFHADVRVLNDGVFTLPLDLAARGPTGVAPAAASVTLAPRGTTTLALDGALADTLAAGRHVVTVDAAASGAAQTVERAFTIAPARVVVEAPASRAANARDPVALVLRNLGGVDAVVAWSMELADASGRVVARASDGTLVRAGETAAPALTIPAQAATGAYRLTATATPPGARTQILRASLSISGTSGTIALTAPAAVEVGAAVPVSALAASTGAPLAGSLVEYVAYLPTPLAAWEGVPGVAGATSAAEHDGARWFGTSTGVARIAADGTTTRFGTAEGLPSARVSALTVARGTLWAGTDRGIARLVGGAFVAEPTMGPLTSTVVRALAGAPDAVWVATDSGVARLDAGGWTAISLPAETARSLAVDAEGGLWAALADAIEGFTGDDSVVPREGTNRPSPALAVDGSGDLHVAYLDNATGPTSLWYRRLDAAGEPRGSAVLLASGEGARANPAIAVDRAGNVHVAWSDHRGGTGDIYYRHLAPDGSLGPETGLVVVGGSEQRWPRVAIDAGGNLAVVWTDDRDPNPPNQPTRRDEVYYLRLAPDGSVLTPATRLTHSVRYVLRPDVGVTPAGDVHIAYTDQAQRCDPEFPTICWWNLETFHAAFRADGTQLSAPRIVSEEDDDMSWLPAIAVDSAGAAHLIFQESEPGGTELAYSRVRLNGAVDIRGALLTNGAPIVRWPQAAARPDGTIDVAWGDTRAGREDAWHNVLHPGRAELIHDEDTRINGDDAGASGFSLRLARSAGGALAAAWEEPGAPGLRVASSVSALLGRGIARVDAASLAAIAYPSRTPPEVAAVAADGDLIAFSVQDAVTFHDRAANAWWTVASPLDGSGPIALRDGAAIVAAPEGLARVDAATEDAAVLPAGGPARALAFAPAARGLLVAGGEAALLLDDREARFWNDTLPIAPGTPTPASFAAPSETGRFLVRARLLSETRQVLAEETRSVFVHDGALTLALLPYLDVARPGEAVDVRVTVGNRGDNDLRGVAVRLDAGSSRVLDLVEDLDAGEARSWTVRVARSDSFDLVAAARGAPLDVAGASTTVEAVVRDHVRVESPAVMASLVAPDVAGRESFAVGALVTNAGLRPVRLSLAVAGAVREIDVPARSRMLVEEMTRLTLLADTILRLSVTGDDLVAAEKTILAGERATLTQATGLSGPVGARTVVLTFRGDGPLATTFPLALALDGAALPPATVEVAPGTTADAQVSLTVPPGLAALEVRTPWEARTLRLSGGTAAVPRLDAGAVAVADGVAQAPIRVENAGPGRLVGDVEIDFGFHVESFAIELVEGAAWESVASASLAGLEPGDARLVVRVMRDSSVAAEVVRPFALPGPRLAFVSSPADATAAPGDLLDLAYEVENVGTVPGPAELRVRVGASDDVTRTVRLAPGERAVVTFPARVEADAVDGLLPVRAAVAGAERVAFLTIEGARVAASAAAGAPRYGLGETGEVVVQVSNPTSRDLDLVARAALVSESAEETLRLAPGASATVRLPLRVVAEEEATWAVTLASGRVLAEGAVTFVLDRLAAEGVRVELSQDAIVAGSILDVTVTTMSEGRVDLLGPGFRDAFLLNGTTTRSYLVPTTVAAGRYVVFWNFDGTNATGALPLTVAGLELRSVELAQEGTTVRWIVRATLGADVVLRAWTEGDAGEPVGAIARGATLVAGDNALTFPAPIAAVPAGPTRLGVSLALPGGSRDVVLLTDSTSFVVPGSAIRSASVLPAGALEYVVRVEAIADPTARLVVVAAGVTVLDEEVSGLASRDVLVRAPEGGTYPIEVVLEGASGRATRALTARVDGPSAPPVSTLTITGPLVDDGDGIRLVTPATEMRVSAVDEGAGVASIEVHDDSGYLDPSRAIRLAPGMHNLTYRARDLAGNVEAERRVTFLVDGAAPTLALREPVRGTVHVAGSLVAGPAPSVVMPTLPAPPEAADADGDGHADAEEIAEGSDPRDPTSTPARWTPAPPPTPQAATVAIGAVRVVADAADDGSGLARVAVLLDGVEVASATAAPFDWTIDLAGTAPGEHELRVVATDRLGLGSSESLLLLVAAPGGDPADARLPAWARAAAAWAQELAATAPDALAADGEARRARIEAEAALVKRDVVDPLTPPVITNLPAHLERNREEIEKALRALGVLA